MYTVPIFVYLGNALLLTGVRLTYTGSATFRQFGELFLAALIGRVAAVGVIDSQGEEKSPTRHYENLISTRLNKANSSLYTSKKYLVYVPFYSLDILYLQYLDNT